jgi:uncharacterized protein (UPF0262 family)
MTGRPRGQKIADIVLEQGGHIHLGTAAAHEREVAIYDLIAENRFKPAGGFNGPFKLRLALEDNRLRFDLRTRRDKPLDRFILPMTPFRRIVRDYFTLCESYYEAIKTAGPERIEAIDMGRRSLHDEGSEMLRARLAKYAEIDFATARRLFTLVCALHIRRM